MNNPSLAIYRARWQRFSSQAHSRWQALALREKRMVAGMAVVLASLLVWVALIEPPLKKIAFWQAETPKLRAQTEALELLLREVNVRPDGQNLEQALQQTLQASGLSGHFQLKADGADTWELSFDAASADAVLDWLLSRPQQLSLRIVEARLQRAGDTKPADNSTEQSSTEGSNTDESAGTLSGIVRMDQALGAKEAS